MKKGFGIVLFAFLAAVAFYTHFSKIAQNLSAKSVKIDTVSSGQIERVLNTNNCQSLKRYVAHFVEVEGTVDDIYRKRGYTIVKTGCLKVIITSEMDLEKGEPFKAKGFIKESNGTLEMTVYDPQNISTSD